MPEILDEKHDHHEHHYQHGTTLLDFCQLQPTQNIDVSFTATNTNSNTTRPHLKDDYNYGNDSCETDMNNRSYIEDNILGMNSYIFKFVFVGKWPEDFRDLQKSYHHQMF